MLSLYLHLVFLYILCKAMDSCVKTERSNPTSSEFFPGDSPTLEYCSMKCARKNVLSSKNYIGMFKNPHSKDCYCHKTTRMKGSGSIYSTLTWTKSCPMPFQSYGIHPVVTTATVGIPFHFILQFKAGQVDFITNGYKFYAIENPLTPNNISERVIVQSVNEITINPRDERNIVTRTSNPSALSISLKIGDHGRVNPLWFVAVQETEQRIKIHVKKMSVIHKPKQSDARMKINTDVDGDVASFNMEIEARKGNTADVEKVSVQINTYPEPKVLEIFTMKGCLPFLIERLEGNLIMSRIPRLFIDSNICIMVKYQLAANKTYLNAFTSYKTHSDGEEKTNIKTYETSIKRNPVQSVVDNVMPRVVGCRSDFVFCLPIGVRGNCWLYNLTGREVIRRLSAKFNNLLGVDNETCTYFFHGPNNIIMFINEQNEEGAIVMAEWHALKTKSTFLASYAIDEENPNITMVTDSEHLFVTTNGIMTTNNQLLVSWQP